MDPKANDTPWLNKARRQDRSYEAKRDAVISAAADLFIRKGYDATSVNDIAAALKVTKPAVYYYFSSKEAILLEINERLQGQISAALARAQGASGTGRDKLVAFCQSYAVLATQPLGQCLVKASWNLVNEPTRSTFRHRLKVLDDTVMSMIREGCNDGSIRAADPRIATACTFGMLNWIAF